MAGAAGLGNLAVHSALGEPFRAEIDLLSYHDGMSQPRLASAELYRMVGFRYNAALSGAQLQQRQHPNGRNFVEITTERRIDEPFLYVLVELESNSARVIRGYAVLLNPYGYRTPGASPPAEYPPMLIPSAAPAVVTPPTPPAAARRAAPPAAVAVAAPVPVAAASAVELQKLMQLEEQSKANAQSLAGMLERVAAMELAVKQLKEDLAKPVPAAPLPPPATAMPPVTASQATPAAPPTKSATELPPRRERSWTESILSEGLLILAGGALLLVLGLGYWMWGRPPVKAKPADRN